MLSRKHPAKVWDTVYDKTHKVDKCCDTEVKSEHDVAASKPVDLCEDNALFCLPFEAIPFIVY